MENRTRLCLAATVASIAIAAPAAAKPVKHAEPVAAHSQKTRPPIVLASAEPVRTPVAKPAEAAKPVTPRVTSCRCGDPDPGDAAADDQ